ncbi:hypothetical protein [Halomicrococcus gelatinilyticus]|uniref:hypothetical protein n=1 Tax=Halomicrococcus gelatinilyticus TaxID=1702103 RepID=UPI002E0E6AC9
MARELTRRRFVAVAGAPTLAALADCSASPDDADAGTESTQSTNATGTGTTTTTPTAESLDLREANVVGVEYDGDGESYRFSVTLFHDDDGEPGYANWWQVETLAGDQLGRRELVHAHGTQRFTRSDTVEIPSGTRYVVVRGHDETHGYGGRAVVVDLDDGTTDAVGQGSKPQSFENYTATVTTG